ncbi:hypothetical protein H6758_01210 [Candidatus Nomurabacteria bacterium]|nr:hypothetical protein [Candidatus Nomurabacteria bacterium]
MDQQPSNIPNTRQSSVSSMQQTPSQAPIIVGLAIVILLIAGGAYAFMSGMVQNALKKTSTPPDPQDVVLEMISAMEEIETYETKLRLELHADLSDLDAAQQTESDTKSREGFSLTLGSSDGTSIKEEWGTDQLDAVITMTANGNNATGTEQRMQTTVSLDSQLAAFTADYRNIGDKDYFRLQDVSFGKPDGVTQEMVLQTIGNYLNRWIVIESMGALAGGGLKMTEDAFDDSKDMSEEVIAAFREIRPMTFSYKESEDENVYHIAVDIDTKKFEVFLNRISEISGDPEIRSSFENEMHIRDLKDLKENADVFEISLKIDKQTKYLREIGVEIGSTWEGDFLAAPVPFQVKIFVGADKFNEAFEVEEPQDAMPFEQIVQEVMGVMMEPSMASARESRMVSTVKQLETGLELYFVDNGHYPKSADFVVVQNGGINCLSHNGFEEVCDPKLSPYVAMIFGEDRLEAFAYKSMDDGASYELVFRDKYVQLKSPVGLPTIETEDESTSDYSGITFGDSAIPGGFTIVMPEYNYETKDEYPEADKILPSSVMVVDSMDFSMSIDGEAGFGEFEADVDGDGLNEFHEMIFGTSPGSADTDGDGFDDLTEILGGYNPLGTGEKDFSEELKMLPELVKESN